MPDYDESLLQLPHPLQLSQVGTRGSWIQVPKTGIQVPKTGIQVPNTGIQVPNTGIRVPLQVNVQLIVRVYSY